MPRSVRLATLCSFCLHGLLILAARYRLSYDAYIHMFFADHYRLSWWSLWDTRWYTGFFVTSYPPLVHQLMALLSQAVGLDAAFAILLWTTVTLLPLAVYSFSRDFVGSASAGFAALGAAFLPSVYLAAHIFGQLPFLFATVLALFGAASLARYLEHGGRLDLALTIALTTTTMAAHHAVLLLQPFLILAIVAKLLLAQDPNRWRSFAIPRPLIFRLVIFGILAILFSLLVVFPFWQWGHTQTFQTPIDHASRHNFFKDPLAPVLFFLPVYGPLLIVIPFAAGQVRRRRFVGLSLAFLILFVLGLGGTTPLPRLFFGKGWTWLTYDRFALWASLVLLPFFGILVALRRRVSKGFGTKFLGALAVSSILVGWFTVLYPLQPGSVNMRPIVDFLNDDDRSNWRYLTFGFGDQLARLSTLTSATTMDGSYHTARTLPELRSSGIAQIDTAFWFPNGLAALDSILQRAGERGVRWGFVNVPQYVPVLEKNGWKKLTTLSDGVEVWENPNAIRPEPSTPPATSAFASFAWGTFPLLSLLVSLSLGSLKLWPLQAARTLRGVHAFLASLLPVTLGFWYYRVIGEFAHDRVYFTYDHALFFLSDALALVAVVLWAAAKIAAAQPSELSERRIGTSVPALGVFAAAFLLFATLSVLWSSDWRTTLYMALHFWLVFLLILSLRDWNNSWRAVIYGLCSALAIQLITGFAGFALQSTAFLQPLHMKWPGVLEASAPGASVVQLQSGWRLLRAYGTLPHPNILGGFTLVTLLGPAGIFLKGHKRNYAALLLYVLGCILLVLSFSRSAWLGFFVFLFFLGVKSKHLDRRRLFLFLAASLVTVLCAIYPLRSFLSTRLSNGSIRTEQISTVGRAWLTRQAGNLILAHPVAGVGLGSFLLELSKLAPAGAPIEPVHNVVLLVAAELGVTGLVLFIVLLFLLARQVLRTISVTSIVASATLVGLSVTSLFDHYLWSLAPGRLMVGLVIGFCLGQERQHAG